MNTWKTVSNFPLRFEKKTKSQLRREKNDELLVQEFGHHDRFKGLDWYVDPSSESRHRCLVYSCLCGKEMKLLPHSVRKGYNPDLLCSDCVQPRRRHGEGSVREGRPSTKA